MFNHRSSHTGNHNIHVLPRVLIMYIIRLIGVFISNGIFTHAKVNTGSQLARDDTVPLQKSASSEIIRHDVILHYDLVRTHTSLTLRPPHCNN